MNLRRRREPGSLADGWRIAIAVAVTIVSGGAAALLFLRDTGFDPDAYDAASSDGNAAFLLAAVAVAGVGYTIWVLLTDVEEAVETKLREHGEDLRHVERFESRLALWLLVAVAVAVAIALVV